MFRGSSGPSPIDPPSKSRDPRPLCIHWQASEARGPSIIVLAILRPNQDCRCAKPACRAKRNIYINKTLVPSRFLAALHAPALLDRTLTTRVNQSYQWTLYEPITDTPHFPASSSTEEKKALPEPHEHRQTNKEEKEKANYH